MLKADLTVSRTRVNDYFIALVSGLVNELRTDRTGLRTLRIQLCLLFCTLPCYHDFFYSPSALIIWPKYAKRCLIIIASRLPGLLFSIIDLFVLSSANDIQHNIFLRSAFLVVQLSNPHCKYNGLHFSDFWWYWYVLILHNFSQLAHCWSFKCNSLLNFSTTSCLSFPILDRRKAELSATSTYPFSIKIY